eukprot:12890018-Prorocentrum_lima.AAC.1
MCRLRYGRQDNCIGRTAVELHSSASAMALQADNHGLREWVRRNSGLLCVWRQVVRAVLCRRCQRKGDIHRRGPAHWQ